VRLLYMSFDQVCATAGTAAWAGAAGKPNVRAAMAAPMAASFGRLIIGLRSSE
jgi:hypothetical protein